MGIPGESINLFVDFPYSFVVPYVPKSDNALFTLFIIETVSLPLTVLSILIHLCKLQGAAFTYLSFVWKSVDRAVLLMDPCISSDFVFSLIRQSNYILNVLRQVVLLNTRWDPCYGYPFWHLPETGLTRDHRTLFLNPAIHHILHQLLVDTDSGSCITSEEICTPTTPCNLLLLTPCSMTQPKR